MSYKGKYKPSYPQKYKGDPTNIIYRSLWERKFMVYCDLNENVLEWSSEEKCVAYRSPIDGRAHRYFPDFLIKVKEENGSIKKYMIEIKPNGKLSHHQNQKDKQKDISTKHMNMLKIKQSGMPQKNGVLIEGTLLK